MSKPVDGQLFARLVEREHAVLSQLFGMRGRQEELITCGRMTELVELLAVRQELIASLLAAHAEITALADRPRNWRASEEQAACARQVEECRAMWQAVMTEDDHCQRLLLKQREQVAAALEETFAAGQAQSVYAAPAPAAGGRRLDLSTET